MDKISLIDFSFLFPVRIDTLDRYQNLLLVIYYLQTYVDSHFIILEADDFQHIDTERLPSSVEYHFIKDSDSKFHRTRYLNELIKKAKTPYLGIWDTDVLISIPQLEEAILLLREEKTSCILPYDGRCITVDPQEKKKFEKSMKLPLRGPVYAEHACGGALIVDKEAFMAAGMCNEYLTSWGPDDVEQKKRLEILGYSFTTLQGPLYHLWHSRNSNSGYQDEGQRLQLVQEYIRIASMNRSELEAYIATWPWLSPARETSGCSRVFSPEQLLNFLRVNEQEQPSTKITEQAIFWLELERKVDTSQGKEKACRLLEGLSEKVQGPVSVNWLATTGIHLLIILKEYDLPHSYRNILSKLEEALFSILYKKRFQHPEDAWQVILYFHELLRSPESFLTYHPVYYKEYLIFATDEAERLIKADYPLAGKPVPGFFSKRSRKMLAIGLFICNLLKETELNQETRKRIQEHLTEYIRQYFSETPYKNKEDIWLLFAWYQIQNNCYRKCRSHQWLMEWQQDTSGQELSEAENTFYQNCCRFGGDPPLPYPIKKKDQESCRIISF